MAANLSEQGKQFLKYYGSARGGGKSAPVVLTPYQEWRLSIHEPFNNVHQFAGTEYWDRKFIRIEVCELCEYWGINGEQAWPKCHRCSQQMDYGASLGELLHQVIWGPPTVQRLLPVKPGAFNISPRRKS